MPVPRPWRRPTGCTRPCPVANPPKLRDQPSTRPARSWCCCGRRTTRQRPTSTTATAPTTSGSACSIGPSRRACPRWVRTCRPSAVSRPDGAAPCCCAASCGVAISTGLIGVLPGMHLAWVFTGLSGLAALGLVGLMAYAKELEAEQRRHRSRHETAPGHRGRGLRRPGDVRLPRRLGRRRLRGAQGRSPLTTLPQPRSEGTRAALAAPGRPSSLTILGGAPGV